MSICFKTGNCILVGLLLLIGKYVVLPSLKVTKMGENEYLEKKNQNVCSVIPTNKEIVHVTLFHSVRRAQLVARACAGR